MIDKTIPPRPSACRCGGPVALNRVKVQHIQSGRFREGTFSEFGDRKRTGKLVMRPGYRFITWLPQCLECMYQSPQEELLA